MKQFIGVPGRVGSHNFSMCVQRAEICRLFQARSRHSTTLTRRITWLTPKNMLIHLPANIHHAQGTPVARTPAK